MVMQAWKHSVFFFLFVFLTKLIVWDSKLYYMGEITSFWTCLSSSSSEIFFEIEKGVKWEEKKSKDPPWHYPMASIFQIIPTFLKIIIKFVIYNEINITK